MNRHDFHSRADSNALHSRRQAFARTILAVILTVTLLVLVGVSWHLLRSHDSTILMVVIHIDGKLEKFVFDVDKLAEH